MSQLWEKRYVQITQVARQNSEAVANNTIKPCRTSPAVMARGRKREAIFELRFQIFPQKTVTARGQELNRQTIDLSFPFLQRIGGGGREGGWQLLSYS